MFIIESNEKVNDFLDFTYHLSDGRIPLDDLKQGYFYRKDNTKLELEYDHQDAEIVKNIAIKFRGEEDLWYDQENQAILNTYMSEHFPNVMTRSAELAKARKLKRTKELLREANELVSDQNKTKPEKKNGWFSRLKK